MKKNMVTLVRNAEHVQSEEKESFIGVSKIKDQKIVPSPQNYQMVEVRVKKANSFINFS